MGELRFPEPDVLVFSVNFYGFLKAFLCSVEVALGRGNPGQADHGNNVIAVFVERALVGLFGFVKVAAGQPGATFQVVCLQLLIRRGR